MKSWGKIWIPFSARCAYVVVTLLLRPRRCPCDITTLSICPWYAASTLEPFLPRLHYARTTSITFNGVHTTMESRSVNILYKLRHIHPDEATTLQGHYIWFSVYYGWGMIILHMMFLVESENELLDCFHHPWYRMRRLRRRKTRSCWGHECVRGFLPKDVFFMVTIAHYNRLMAELRMEDRASFFNFLRMPLEMFDELRKSVLRAWLSRSKTVTRAQLRRGERCWDAVIASFARSAIRLVVVKTQWAQCKRCANVALSVCMAWWKLVGRNKSVVKTQEHRSLSVKDHKKHY